MQKDLLLPGSILLGCTIIGAGLYLGLRSQPPASAPGVGAPATIAVSAPARSNDASSVAASPTAAAAPPAPMGMPGMGGIPGVAGPSVSPDVQVATEKAALAALADEKKKVYLAKCWEPALKAQPKPAAAKFSLDTTFDPQGAQITLGVSEDRSAPRPDVAQCIRELPMSLRVAPPGVPVRVTLPLEFP